MSSLLPLSILPEHKQTSSDLKLVSLVGIHSHLGECIAVNEPRTGVVGPLAPTVSGINTGIEEQYMLGTCRNGMGTGILSW